MARAGALAGAGALAAASLACRRHEPARNDCLRLEAPQAPVGFDATFSINAKLDCPDLRAAASPGARWKGRRCASWRRPAAGSS